MMCLAEIADFTLQTLSNKNIIGLDVEMADLLGFEKPQAKHNFPQYPQLTAKRHRQIEEVNVVVETLVVAKLAEDSSTVALFL